MAFAVGRSTAPAAAAHGSGAATSGNGDFRAGGSFPGAPDAQRRPGRRRARGFGGRGGGLTISGTVESVDGDTMTITTADGQTIEVTLDGDTDLPPAGRRRRRPTSTTGSSVRSRSRLAASADRNGGAGDGPGTGGTVHGAARLTAGPTSPSSPDEGVG